MNKRSSLGLYIVIFALFALIGMVYQYYKEQNQLDFQNNTLKSELIEIATRINADTDYDNVKMLISRTVTTGEEAKIERKAKDYFHQLVTALEKFNAVGHEDFNSHFDIETINRDRPNFSLTYSYINEVLEKNENTYNDLIKLLDENYIADYIEDEDVVYHVNVVGSKAAVTASYNELKVLMSDCRTLINFLRDHNADWHVEGNYYVFNYDWEVEEYNNIAKKITKISNF